MPVGSELLYSNFCSGSVVTSAPLTVVTLLPANNERNAFWVYNHANASLFVRVGGSASLSNFSFKMTSGSLVQIGPPCPREFVTAMWDTASGSAMVTTID